MTTTAVSPVAHAQQGADKSASRRALLPVVVAALSCWASALSVAIVGSHLRKPWLALCITLIVGCIPALASATRSQRRAHQNPARIRVLIGLCLSVALFAGISACVSVNAILASPLAKAAEQTAVVTADVRITGDPHEVRSRGTRYNDAWIVDATVIAVRVHHRMWQCATPVRLLLSPRDAHVIAMGEGYRVIARARPARVADRSAAYLDVIAPPTFIHSAPWWAAAAGEWRAGLRKAAASSNLDATGLLPALAIGDTSLAPSTLTDDMRAAGLSHLSAVSGANVSIVLTAVALLALLVGIRGRWLGLVCAVTLIWFVAVARPSPSVVRAAVMGAIGVLPVLLGWRRKPGGVDALLALSLATGVLIVIDPWLSVSWGFALSCAATAGLVLGASALMRRFGGWFADSASGVGASSTRASQVAPLLERARAGGSKALRWLARWFVAALSVTVCAQLAVTPLLIAMGGSISWVALPANVLAEPAVAPATISGLLASAVSQVSPATAEVIAKPGLIATGWIATVAHRSASAAASLHLPHLWRRNAFPHDTVAVLCDVGQGTAFALPIGQGRGIVIDVGPDPDLIDSCLRRLGIGEISLLVLSHFHADHVAGLPGALRGRSVGAVLISPLPEPALGAELVSRELLAHGVRATRVSRAAALDVGNAHVDVLSPSTLLHNVESPPNDDCVAVTITMPLVSRKQPLRVLAPCDLEFAGQARLLNSVSRVPGHFDIALVPHHGSSKQLPAFAQWASPKVALIPVGRDNDYGHPAPEALAMWRKVSRSVLRTDVDGDVAISSSQLLNH